MPKVSEECGCYVQIPYTEPGGGYHECPRHRNDTFMEEHLLLKAGEQGVTAAD